MVGVIMVAARVAVAQVVAVVVAVVPLLLVKTDQPPTRVEMVVRVFNFLQHLEIHYHQ